jgi:UDP-hydrolysing UDP-N-acetyl-D-glucosamine 2-epimerase
LKIKRKIKKVLFISGSRAEFFILEKLFYETLKYFDTKILLHAGHTQKKYGQLIKDIKKKISKKNILSIKTNFGNSNNELQIIKSFAKQVDKIGKKLLSEKPSVVILVGDRTETLAAASASVICNIPIIHIHGGELSLGSMDEKLRHAISKLSSIHFVSHKIYKKRLIQMGENKSKIKIIGAPALLNYSGLKIDKISFFKKFDLTEKKYILVCLNSYILKKETDYFSEKMFNALDKFNITKIVTYPNPDLYNKSIIDNIEKRKKRKDYKIFKFLGGDYPKFLKYCNFLIGNTSSGIIEAPYFSKFFLNLGSRQEGREFSKKTTINLKINNKNMPLVIQEILKKKYTKSENLYYNKNCLKIFIKCLKKIDLEEFNKKIFFDKL